MKLASMQPMEVVPVPEERPKSKIIKGEALSEDGTPALEPAFADAASGDVMEDETTRGLDRFIRYLQRQKRFPRRDSRRRRAVIAYESARNPLEAQEIVGVQLDKAA